MLSEADIELDFTNVWSIGWTKNGDQASYVIKIMKSIEQYQKLEYLPPLHHTDPQV